MKIIDNLLVHLQLLRLCHFTIFTTRDISVGRTKIDSVRELLLRRLRLVPHRNDGKRIRLSVQIKFSTDSTEWRIEYLVILGTAVVFAVLLGTDKWRSNSVFKCTVGCFLDMDVFSSLVGRIEVHGKVCDRECLILVLIRSRYQNLEVIILLGLIGQDIREESNVKVDSCQRKIKHGTIACAQIFVRGIVAFMLLSVAFQNDGNVSV